MSSEAQTYTTADDLCAILRGEPKHHLSEFRAWREGLVTYDKKAQPSGEHDRRVTRRPRTPVLTAAGEALLVAALAEGDPAP